MTKNFVKSAHAKWIDESDETMRSTRTEPIPDPPSDINKLLNSVEVEGVSDLVEILEAMKLDYPRITESVRRQDEASENVRVLAAGFHRSYRDPTNLQ